MSNKKNNWEDKLKGKNKLYMKAVKYGTCDLQQINRIDKLLLKTRQDAIKEEREKMLKVFKRLNLEIDVCVCDCGEKWSDSDLANLVNQEVDKLNKQLLK